MTLTVKDIHGCTLRVGDVVEHTAQSMLNQASEVLYGHMMVQDLNDRESTTHDMILKVLKLAIDRAKEIEGKSN